jgi:hypothetical protein
MQDVLAAARALERRGTFEGVPFERYTQELWSLIDQRLPGFGPPWLRRLSLDFRLGGAGFQLKVDENSWTGRCIIPRPSNALLYVYHSYSSWVIEGLFKHRFVCFADGQNEYGWVFHDDGDPDPEVHFFERSAWDGGEASERNGLLRINMKFSQFLQFGASWTPGPLAGHNPS